MSSALLVIDVQGQPVSELSPGRRNSFLATIAALVRNARNRTIPVVYVRHQDSWMQPETDGWQIADEVAPQSGEPIVEKRFRDAFRDTDLAEVLERLNARHLIVCGMQSEICVDATIREAERRGYRVDLVSDAHATAAAGGLTEEQIIAHVNRVAAGDVARLVTASHALKSLE